MRKLLRKFFAWADGKWWIKVLIVPALASTPPVLLSSTKWNPDLETWLASHPWTLAVLILWPLTVVGVSSLHHKFRPPKFNDSTDLATLLEVLRRIVAAKVNRFSAALLHFRESGDSGARKIFSRITRPDEQIEEIVQGIHQYFEATRPRDVSMPELTIRVTLAKMGARHIDSFTCFYPPEQSPRSKPETLNYDESGLSRAMASRRIVVVEDFLAESQSANGRSYVVTDKARAEENGSMLCYPVVVSPTQEVPFVISVCTAKPNYFKKSDADFHSKILEYFAQRISLEYCLKNLKALAR